MFMSNASDYGLMQKPSRRRRKMRKLFRYILLSLILVSLTVVFILLVDYATSHRSGS
jgi:hypothetical protein